MGNMTHQGYRSSSPTWRNPLALGILVSGVCASFHQDKQLRSILRAPLAGHRRLPTVQHGVDVTGAGLERVNGRYEWREARDWKHTTGCLDRQWYESDDGVFIIFSRRRAQWEMGTRFGVKYIAKHQEKDNGNPAEGWELAVGAGMICQKCRGKTRVPVDESWECSMRATEHGFWNWSHTCAKECPKCDGTGTAEHVA